MFDARLVRERAREILIPLLVGLALAMMWFGPAFVIAAHPAELRPWPSLGTIFEAVGDALGNRTAAKVQKRTKKVVTHSPGKTAGTRHAASKVVTSAAMAYAQEPDRKTEVYSIVVRERTVPATGGVIAAIIKVESRGNPRARGRAGEYGLMQIQCRSAREVGFRGNCSALLDPATNVRYGTAYYRLALRKTGGNVDHALSLYQRGVHSGWRGCSAYCRMVKAAMR